MRKTATKLCGYGGTNIPVVGKITVRCEFCDAEEFHIVKTGSKTEVKSQKQHDEIEDKNHYQTNGGDESEIMKKVPRLAGKSGKKLKEEIVEMYPALFKGLGRMEPEHQIKLFQGYSKTLISFLFQAAQ